MARFKKNKHSLEEEELYNTAFRDVFKRTAYESDHHEKKEPKKDTASSFKTTLSGKVAIRIERKGRGGKTVTLVETANGTLEEKDLLAKYLRKQLGCGSSIENETIVVQGDQRERIKTLLEKEGVKRISIS